MQIEKDVIHENSTRIDYDYRVGDQVVLNNKVAHKYENSFKVPYKTVQMWTNITETLQMGVVTTRMKSRML